MTAKTLFSLDPSLEHPTAYNKSHRFKHSKDHLEQINAEIALLLAALSFDNSWLTQAAAYWGKQPLWQKIALGLFLTFPVLSTGFILHSSFCLLFGFYTLACYVGVSLLLDNHYHHKVESLHTLKQRLYALTAILTNLIHSLDAQHAVFLQDLNTFAKENVRLAGYINELEQQVTTLTDQIQRIKVSANNLELIKTDLEATLAQLNSELAQQRALFTQARSQLDDNIDHHAQCQKSLHEKVMELQQVKTQMWLEVKQQRQMTKVLQQSLSSLANTVLLDTDQRHSYLTKLDTFLNDKEGSFSILAERISDSEHKLAQTTAELTSVRAAFAHNMAYHEQILKSQAQQIERLSSMQVLPANTVRSTQQVKAPDSKEPHHRPAFFQKTPCSLLPFESVALPLITIG